MSTAQRRMQQQQQQLQQQQLQQQYQQQQQQRQSLVVPESDDQSFSRLDEILKRESDVNGDALETDEAAFARNIGLALSPRNSNLSDNAMSTLKHDDRSMLRNSVGGGNVGRSVLPERSLLGDSSLRLLGGRKVSSKGPPKIYDDGEDDSRRSSGRVNSAHRFSGLYSNISDNVTTGPLAVGEGENDYDDLDSADSSRSFATAQQQRRRKHRSRSNVSTKRVGSRWRRLKLDFSDPFHSVINWPWWRVILVVSAIHIAFWFTFGFFFWLCAADGCIGDAKQTGWAQDSIWLCFFFAVETMTTIGFGDMYPQTKYASLIVMFASLASVFAEATTIGIVYAKFARATARAASIVFSRKCIIGTRNGIPSLVFRIANLRKHQLIESHVSLFLAYPEKTDEGEVAFRFDRLETEDIGPFLSSVPTTVVHVLDESSPFYNNPRILERAELVILLEGIDSTTSDTTQARHSYVQDDVVYNARFSDVISFDSNTGEIVVRMDDFDGTVPVELPSKFDDHGLSENMDHISASAAQAELLVN